MTGPDAALRRRVRTIWLLQLLGASNRLGPAALTSLLVGMLALAASTLHLGRPAYAYRALKMWKRSWLSREVLLFSRFRASRRLYAVVLWMARPGGTAIGALTVTLGLGGRHRQRLHLPGSLTAGLEHAVHARAVRR